MRAKENSSPALIEVRGESSWPGERDGIPISVPKPLFRDIEITPHMEFAKMVATLQAEGGLASVAIFSAVFYSGNDTEIKRVVSSANVRVDTPYELLLMAEIPKSATRARLIINPWRATDGELTLRNFKLSILGGSTP